MKLNSGMHLSQVKNQWNDENRRISNNYGKNITITIEDNVLIKRHIAKILGSHTQDSSWIHL